MTDIIHAPFTDEQRAALQAWQECGHTHPLTCGNCASSMPLIAEKRGLVCAVCFHVQDCAPALCLTLPPSPAAILAANQSESTNETD